MTPGEEDRLKRFANENRAWRERVESLTAIVHLIEKNPAHYWDADQFDSTFRAKVNLAMLPFIREELKSLTEKIEKRKFPEIEESEMTESQRIFREFL